MTHGRPDFTFHPPVHFWKGKPAGLAVLCLFIVLTGAAFPAEAQISSLTLNTELTCENGVPVGGTTVFSSRPDAPGGTSYCNTGGWFSDFFCMFESTLGIAIAHLMCRLQEAWLAPLMAFFTLAIVLTGAMFATGMLNLTVKEVSILLLKMALIATFALHTPAALQIAYAFFINVTKSTVGIVESLFTPASTPQNPTPTPPDFFGEPDQQVAAFHGWASGTSGPTMCTNMLKLLLVILVLLAPVIAAPVFFAVVAYFMVFARAAAGYAYSLTMITFLLAASPIFLSLGLFTSTKEMFDDWLKQMGSNVIQIFIIFAFLAFMNGVDIFRFFKDLSNIVMPYKAVFFHLGPFNSLPIGMEMCTLCGPDQKFGGMIEVIDEVPQIKQGASCGGANEAIPLTMLLTDRAFLTFVAIHVAALYILTEALDRMLVMAPQFATQLGGQRYAYTMGADSRSANMSPLIGGKLQENVMGGMQRGWRDTRRGFGIGHAFNAMREGVRSGIYGQQQLTSVQVRRAKQDMTQNIARAEARRLNLQDKYNKSLTVFTSLRAAQERGLARQRARLAQSKGRQQALRVQHEQALTLRNMAAMAKSRGVSDMEMKNIRRRSENARREIDTLARTMQQYDTGSQEYAKAAEQRLALQQKLRELQKSEEYIRSWGKNGVSDAQMQKLEDDLRAAEQALKQSDHEVALEERSLQRTERISKINGARESLTLGVVQKELRDTEIDKQAAEEEWQRIRKARKQDGLREDIFNPEIDDAHGQAERGSQRFGLESYSEDAAEHRRIMEQRKKETRQQQQLWYMMMKE